MKCARCGRDVPDDAPRCPYCEQGAAPLTEEKQPALQCPNCGSVNIHAVRRNYSPGCGCLGLLLFGWWGLLLGLLGFDQVDMVCADCGTQWPAGKIHRAHRGGCLIFHILLVLAGSCMAVLLLFCLTLLFTTFYLK